jgi:hypothetical protein
MPALFRIFRLYGARYVYLQSHQVAAGLVGDARPQIGPEAFAKSRQIFWVEGQLTGLRRVEGNTR